MLVVLLKTADIVKGAFVDPCEKKLSVYFNSIIASDMALPELAAIDGTDAPADVYFQVSADPGEYSRAREWLHHWR